MYSRTPRDARIPSNYGGSMFGARPMPATPVEDLTRHAQKAPPPAPVPPPHTPDYPPSEQLCEQSCTQEEEHGKRQSSILSPFGALGTEELLLIALALIVFQGGNEPELALILLALLFIN